MTNWKAAEMLFVLNSLICFVLTALPVVAQAGSDSLLAVYPVGSDYERTELYVDRGEGVQAVVEDFVGIEFEVEDTLLSDGLRRIDVSLRNTSPEPFAPLSMGIRLPLDPYMESYPSWLDKWSPIYLYCDSDHFLGYAQTPSGRLKGIFSANPIACWTLDYNLGYPDPLWFYGHRIEGIRLDLLHAEPLPRHHPHTLSTLDPGQSLHWKICLVDIPSLEEFPVYARRFTLAPVFDASKTCYSKGEEVSVRLYARSPRLRVSSPQGRRVRSSRLKIRDGLWEVSFTADREGDYDIMARDGEKSSNCIITVHRPWHELVGIARNAVWTCPQKPTSHVESWYGFFSAFLAARTMPSAELDSLLDERFDYILGKLYSEDGQPRYYSSRIQNTALTISMLVDRWKAYGRIEDLIFAGKMADWLISSSQAESGAYMRGDTKYTSVIYVAKSILELSLAERQASEDRAFETGNSDSPVSRTSAALSLSDAADRHFDSARRAVLELVRSNGDFQTEGEQTFEDGMISCSALQIGFLALNPGPDDTLRDTLTRSFLSLLDSHDCLTQLYIPDGRRRGGTLRFWESQYDVLMLPDMISSPHGWSAWRAYASYYAYLLTGDEKWLLQTWNAAGAFADLVSSEGVLRWAFVVNPYVCARQTRKPVAGCSPDSLSFGNPHPDVLGAEALIVGEQYVDMVSSYQGINTQDNDVHEVFRFIGETFLENAFVVEREDGSLGCYNCRLDDGKLIPAGGCIRKVHFNLRSPRDFVLAGRTLRLPAGMTWKSL